MKYSMVKERTAGEMRVDGVLFCDGLLFSMMMKAFSMYKVGDRVLEMVRVLTRVINLVLRKLKVEGDPLCIPTEVTDPETSNVN
jgi:hypothetical protein